MNTNLDVKLFSDRNHYTEPCLVLRREHLDEECIAEFCTCYDYLEQWMNTYDRNAHCSFFHSYLEMEEYTWCFFLHQRKKEFRNKNGNYETVSTRFLEDPTKEWYEIFNLIEFSLYYLNNCIDSSYQHITQSFINILNSTFIRLNLAYRIINYLIVEITNPEEISAIRIAQLSGDNIQNHLSSALQHLSNHTHPDYRNSIKESISAVECMCRSVARGNTLGEALKNIEQNNNMIPRMLKASFEKLYAYTNDLNTGIRHALLEGNESPGFDEAKFMLVACSAFINYLQAKTTG